MTFALFANYVKKKLKASHKKVLEKRGFLVHCTLKYSFLTDYIKGIHLSVEAYRPNKDYGGWERKLLQQEPNPFDIFVLEKKKIEFVGQETNTAAPEEVIFSPQVERYVQAMQHLTNLPSPLMFLLWPVLAPIWVAYGFWDASAEGFCGKYQPISQLLRIHIGFWCTE